MVIDGRVMSKLKFWMCVNCFVWVPCTTWITPTKTRPLIEVGVRSMKSWGTKSSFWCNLCWFVYLDSLQIRCAHYWSLVEFHRCKMPLEKSFKFQIRRLSIVQWFKESQVKRECCLVAVVVIQSNWESFHHWSSF